MMRPDYFFAIVLSILATGCARSHLPATARLAAPRPAFPSDGLIIQRGVLTIRGREFPLNGYVATSATNGVRLVVSGHFEGVLADVLVQPDGTTWVMECHPPFRVTWVKQFVAEDLKCIFSIPTSADCPLQILSATHFQVQRRWYTLNLRTVEIKPGAQPAALFQPAKEAGEHP